MALVTLSRIERRRLTVFFTCLVAAVITWLIIALSGKYRYRVETRLNYVSVPENRAYHPLQDDSVSLEVEGSGWQLLFYRLRINPEFIDVNLADLKSKNYIVFSNQLSLLNRQLESNQRVISVSPDTLFFDFSKRTVKKVPVKLTRNLGFEKNYDISGPIRLTPSKVVVNGATEDVKKIDIWPTSELQGKGLNADFSAKVTLNTNYFGTNVDVYPSTVKVEIPVDRFTEKVLEVPVTVINAQAHEVKLVPERIKVTLSVALKNYSKADRDSVIATVNLSDWTDKNATQLPVRFAKIPRYSRIIKVEPQVVDFYINR